MVEVEDEIVDDDVAAVDEDDAVSGAGSGRYGNGGGKGTPAEDKEAARWRAITVARVAEALWRYAVRPALC